MITFDGPSFVEGKLDREAFRDFIRSCKTTFNYVLWVSRDGVVKATQFERSWSEAKTRSKEDFSKKLNAHSRAYSAALEVTREAKFSFSPGNRSAEHFGPGAARRRDFCNPDILLTDRIIECLEFLWASGFDGKEYLNPYFDNVLTVENIKFQLDTKVRWQKFCGKPD